MDNRNYAAIIFKAAELYKEIADLKIDERGA
jgi:hypothetical protein